MKTRSMIMTVLLSLLVGFATPVTAKTPRGRPMSGIIQQVNLQTREVELLRADNGTLFTFVWSNLTTFVMDGHSADAAILKQGTRVDVLYHEPFFGKPYVRRVTLQPTAKIK